MARNSADCLFPQLPRHYSLEDTRLTDEATKADFDRRICAAAWQPPSFFPHLANVRYRVSRRGHYNVWGRNSVPTVRRIPRMVALTCSSSNGQRACGQRMAETRRPSVDGRLPKHARRIVNRVGPCGLNGAKSIGELAGAVRAPDSAPARDCRAAFLGLRVVTTSVEASV
jgi:hypothetical protein